MTKTSRREELLFHNVSNRNSIYLFIFLYQIPKYQIVVTRSTLIQRIVKILCLRFQVQTGFCCASPAATVRTRSSRSGGRTAPTTKTSYKDWRRWVRSVDVLPSVTRWKSENECVRIAVKAVLVRRVSYRINVSFRHPEFLSGPQTVSPGC